MPPSAQTAARTSAVAARPSPANCTGRSRSLFDREGQQHGAGRVERGDRGHDAQLALVGGQQVEAVGRDVERAGHRGERQHRSAQPQRAAHRPQQEQARPGSTRTGRRPAATCRRPRRPAPAAGRRSRTWRRRPARARSPAGRSRSRPPAGPRLTSAIAAMAQTAPMSEAAAGRSPSSRPPVSGTSAEVTAVTGATTAIAPLASPGTAGQCRKVRQSRQLRPIPAPTRRADPGPTGGKLRSSVWRTTAIPRSPSRNAHARSRHPVRPCRRRSRRCPRPGRTCPQAG